MSFTLAFLICILSFLVWLGSLIILIVVKKNDSAPPEIVSLRKRAKGFNIALISMTVCSWFIFFFDLLGLAMIVLSVLCIIDSVKLLNARPQAQQQFGRQNYQQQNYIPQQQAQPAPQQQFGRQNYQQQNYIPQQQAQPAPQQQFGRQNYQQQNYIPQQQAQPAPQQQAPKCLHCGAEIEVGSYFCVHCGKKI